MGCCGCCCCARCYDDGGGCCAAAAAGDVDVERASHWRFAAVAADAAVVGTNAAFEHSASLWAMLFRLKPLLQQRLLHAPQRLLDAANSCVALVLAAWALKVADVVNRPECRQMIAVVKASISVHV